MLPGRISLLAQHISTDEAMMVIVPIYGVILIVLIVANWKLFAKAGQPGWASIIPISIFCPPRPRLRHTPAPPPRPGSHCRPLTLPPLHGR